MGSRTERAHQKYREGQYEEALQLYSDALDAAKLPQHKIALHSNKAACHLKLKNYRKVCILLLVLSHRLLFDAYRTERFCFYFPKFLCELSDFNCERYGERDVGGEEREILAIRDRETLTMRDEERFR
jgi:hypothetical protein